MSQKPPKCYQCGTAFVRRVAPPHHRKLRHEGAAHEVLVTDMPEWHCAACNLSVTDEEGDEPLQAALRRHVGLLTPQQIKAGIKDLGITQEKFAEKIRCAPEAQRRRVAVSRIRLLDADLFPVSGSQGRPRPVLAHGIFWRDRCACGAHGRNGERYVRVARDGPGDSASFSCNRCVFFFSTRNNCRQCIVAQQKPAEPGLLPETGRVDFIHRPSLRTRQTDRIT